MKLFSISIKAVFLTFLLVGSANANESLTSTIKDKIASIKPTIKDKYVESKDSYILKFRDDEIRSYVHEHMDDWMAPIVREAIEKDDEYFDIENLKDALVWKYKLLYKKALENAGLSIERASVIASERISYSGDYIRFQKYMDMIFIGRYNYRHPEHLWISLWNYCLVGITHNCNEESLNRLRK